MWHRYWTQGHAERHHGGVLVRVQGRAVCVHRAGEEEAGAQVDWRSSKLGHVSKFASSRASLYNDPETKVYEGTVRVFAQWWR